MNTEQKIIKNKVGLLKLSEMLGSVSEACKVFIRLRNGQPSNFARPFHGKF